MKNVTLCYIENSWCLPGGFINIDETSKEASNRVLTKETGLTDVYMQQLKVNDEVTRDPRGRTISVSYMALIDRTLLENTLREEASWFDIEIEEQEDLYTIKLTNTEDTISYQVKRNAIDLKSEEYNYDVIENNTDIVFNLMPQEFTIGELKQVYELLLNKTLVNSAFRRTIADKVILTDKMIKTGGHRPSILCKYNEKR